MPEPASDPRFEHLLGGLQVDAPQPRLLFEIAGRVVGSLLPDDAELLRRAVPGLALDDDALSLMPVCAGDTNASLNAIALALRDAGRSARWRHERLPVLADDGSLLGAIERGCMRVLGLRTLSVHLVGETRGPDGRIDGCWLQRRALHKDTDPGMLDNLASGLVGLGSDARSVEPLALAMRREAAEEAGLDEAALGALTALGRWRLQMPVREGMMIEDVIVYRALLAAGARPDNVDGEVSEFVHLAHDEVLTRIDRGELTRGASLGQLACLRWHRSAD
ncbi:MAG: NUDIX domain-containing protein [Burkholderiaceae bacterium]